MDRHRVTILVCTHDDGPTLGEALESALVQTAPRSLYRVLVVDDASTDDTPRVLERFRPAGVEVVRLPVNAGLAGACNAGLEHILTPFYVRLDGDDLLEPDAVAALVERADETGADIVSSDRWEEHPTGRRARVLTEPPEVRDLVAAGTLLPADLVRAVGGYRPLFWEEYDLYLRLLEDAGCTRAHVPRPLYTYRTGDGMTSDIDAVEAGWRELRDLWPEATLARHGLTDVRHGLTGHGR